MLLTYSRCLARNMPTVESCLRSSLKPLLTVGFVGAESSDSQQGLASVRCATKNWSLIFIHTLCGPVLEILCVSAHLVLKGTPRLLSDHPYVPGRKQMQAVAGMWGAEKGQPFHFYFRKKHSGGKRKGFYTPPWSCNYLCFAVFALSLFSKYLLSLNHLKVATSQSLQ